MNEQENKPRSIWSAAVNLGRRGLHRLGSMIDAAIAVPFPGFALRRMAARQCLSAFDAAKRDRTTFDWATDRNSPDGTVLPELPDMTSRARQSVRNDWAGNSIVGAYRRNDVGVGITPMAAAVFKTGKPRSAFNKTADKLWRRWARNPKLVDSEKTKSFYAMMRLAVTEWKTVGQAFIIHNYESRPGSVGLSLTMFELEQLAQDIDCTPQPGNEIRGGVEVSIETGEAKAYWVHVKDHPHESLLFQGNKGSAYPKPQRIEADRVLHLHRQTRPGETLSPSPLSPVLAKMHGQKRYDDNEQFAKGLESFLGFAIKRDPAYGLQQIGFNPPTGSTPGPGGGDSSDSNGNRQIDFQPGMMPVLLPGEEIQMFNPSRPGSMYRDYTEVQVGQMGAGAGVCYATVSRDYSKGNFSSQRQGRLEDEKEYDIDQQDLIDMVHRPVWELFITYAILEGKLIAPNFLSTGAGVDEDYLEVEWQPPPRPWIDPAKEAAAAKISRELFLEDLGMQQNRMGRNWRDVLERFAEIRDAAEEKDIMLPEFLPAEEAALAQAGAGSVKLAKKDPHEPNPRGKASAPRGTGKKSLSASSQRLVDEILSAAMRDED